MAREQGCNHHYFICNGGAGSSRSRRAHDALAKRLSTGRDGSIQIRIETPFDPSGQSLSDRALDLLDIAAFVYVADHTTLRVPQLITPTATTPGRHFHFEIAVRDPVFWSRRDVVEPLCDTLHFLSDDVFEFRFSQHSNPPSPKEYFAFSRHTSEHRIHRVLVFTGNVDSLTGTAEEVFEHERPIAVVTHQPTTYLRQRHKILIDRLSEEARRHVPHAAPLHVPAIVRGRNWNGGIDFTQCTRSFLHMTLGATVAGLFEIADLHFYENGIASINLPLAEHHASARAGRTSHPKTVAGLSAIFSHVFDDTFEIRNNYLWHTKEDVARHLQALRQDHLLPETISCTHIGGTTEVQSHCGRCAHCLARRLAVIGAGLSEPTDLYQRDVITGARPGEPYRVPAERILSFAQQLALAEDTSAFSRRFAHELSRITLYLNESKDVALERICDLHGRYADQVNSVITGVMGRYVRDYYARKLERTSALAIAFGLGSEPSVKERTIGRAEPASDGQGLLNADERLVLEILARAKHLMTQATILAETSTRQHRLGKRTLSRIARSLEARGLLHRPAGPRKGVELTAAGRELFDGGIGTSA